jgi:hypothetical protein
LSGSSGLQRIGSRFQRFQPSPAEAVITLPR